MPRGKLNASVGLFIKAAFVAHDPVDVSRRATARENRDRTWASRHPY